MSNDALERLKNRQRPTVPKRNATLTSSNQDIQISGSPDINNDYQELESNNKGIINPKQRFEASETKTIIDPKKRFEVSTNKDISISRNPDDLLKTKQTTLRLELGLSDRLSDICKVNKISREVFIEALFEYYETHHEVEGEILTNAISKAEYRTEIANLKRAKTMMEKFNS